MVRFIAPILLYWCYVIVRIWKRVVNRRNMSVEDLIRSQLKSEEKFTDQLSSHFKLCIAVNFKSLQKQTCPKLWRAIWHSYNQAQARSCGWKENALCTPNFRDKLPFVNSTKSLIFDLTKILLPKHLVLTYSLIAKVMYYQIPFTELKSSY